MGARHQAAAVEQWRAEQEAARRHRIQQVRARAERHDGDWQPPTSRAVQRLVAEARVRIANGPVTDDGDEQDLAAGAGTAPLALSDLTQEQITEMRAMAYAEYMAGQTTHLMAAYDLLGPAAAQYIYGADLVREVLKLARSARSTLTTLGQA